MWFRSWAVQVASSSPSVTWPSSGMTTAPFQVGWRQSHPDRRFEAGTAQCRELVEPLVDRLVGLLQLCEPVERFERAGESMFEDDACARDPVGLLAVDEVPHDVVRAPGFWTFVVPNPRTG